MKIIENELQRCEAIALSGNKDLSNSREYKDDREWWILGKVAECLQKANQGFPVLARHQYPPDPDFITFNVQKSRFKPIEITEVLLPNRKRGDEIKNRNK